MSDEQEIKQDFVLSIAYDEIKADLVEAKGMYSSILKKLEPVELYKNLSHLIERLDYGIPPNAYEKTINNREPATVAEIINSVWFHKLSWEDQLLNGEGNFNENICPKRNRLNQLALKALEYSDIEKEYIEWYFKEHGHFPKYEDEQ